TTDHLPFRSASVTSMNWPALRAWALNGFTSVLIRDIFACFPWLVERMKQMLRALERYIQLIIGIASIGINYLHVVARKATSSRRFRPDRWGGNGRESGPHCSDPAGAAKPS